MSRSTDLPPDIVIIGRWRRGDDIMDATESTTYGGAKRKISVLRKEYGIEIVPRRIGARDGGWYWQGQRRSK